MSIRKGHCYASVFADLKARRVLYATEGKDHTVWDRFAQELGRHNGHPHALLHVSMGFLDVFSGTGAISFTEKTQPEYLFRTLLPQCVSIMARLP